MVGNSALPAPFYHNALPACQGLSGSKETNAVLGFPTVLVLHGMIGFDARMPARICCALRDRHHFCRVPTDDLPHSAVAIVFRHVRVKLLLTEGEPEPSYCSSTYRLHIRTPSQAHTSSTGGTNRRGDCLPRYRSSTEGLRITYGRGGDVGRPRGDGRVRGVALGVALGVTLPIGVGVAVAVGVTEGVTDGLGVGVGVTEGVGSWRSFRSRSSRWESQLAFRLGVGVGVGVGLGVEVGVDRGRRSRRRCWRWSRCGPSFRHLESIHLVISGNVDASASNNTGSL